MNTHSVSMNVQLRSNYLYEFVCGYKSFSDSPAPSVVELPHVRFWIGYVTCDVVECVDFIHALPGRLSPAMKMILLLE